MIPWIGKLSFAAALGVLIALGGVAHAYESAPVVNGGTITGVVRFDGTPPKPARLEVGKDKEVCGARPLYDQSVIVGSGGGLKDAVVAIADIERGEPLKPAAAVIFDQKGCEYTPHVAAFPAGSTVKVLNSDGILHSVHTESSINPVIDMAQPGFKKSLSITIEKPEAIKVTCDAHNWMEGWWYVAGNPYYSMTDGSGRFTIANVPAGTYTLRVWHEELGEVTKQVRVGAGATVTVDFAMKPKKG